MKATHQVTIQAVDNGFIVRVGCRLYVADCWSKIAEQLDAYFACKETPFIKEELGKSPTAQEVYTAPREARIGGQSLADSVAKG